MVHNLKKKLSEFQFEFLGEDNTRSVIALLNDQPTRFMIYTCSIIECLNSVEMGEPHVSPAVTLVGIIWQNLRGKTCLCSMLKEPWVAELKLVAPKKRHNFNLPGSCRLMPTCQCLQCTPEYMPLDESGDTTAIGTRALWWIFCLGKAQLRHVLVGLKTATGSSTDCDHVVWTSSVHMRDDILLMCLHAGYSACFSCACEDPPPYSRVDCLARELARTVHKTWAVIYTDSPVLANPELCKASDVRVVAYTGRTWCASIPKGYLVVRRALVDGNRYVVDASRATIQGNCDEGIDFKAMGRIFVGLVESGAWGCFDDDHQLLTNNGFMFLDDILSCKDSGLQFASYDADKKTIRYAHALRVVVHPNSFEEMVEFSQANEPCLFEAGRHLKGLHLHGVSLSVTQDHDIYANQVTGENQLFVKTSQDFRACYGLNLHEPWITTRNKQRRMSKKTVLGKDVESTNELKPLRRIEGLRGVRHPASLLRRTRNNYRSEKMAAEDLEAGNLDEAPTTLPTVLALAMHIGCPKIVSACKATPVHTCVAAHDCFRRVKAGELIALADKSAVVMLTVAENGLNTSANYEIVNFIQAVLVGLGLKSEDKQMAFLRFYGCWLGNGCLRFTAGLPGAIVTALRKADLWFVLQQLKTCEIDDSYFKIVPSGAMVGVHVTEPRWARFFFGEYAHTYKCADMEGVRRWLGVVVPTDDFDTKKCSSGTMHDKCGRRRSLAVYQALLSIPMMDDEDADDSPNAIIKKSRPHVPLDATPILMKLRPSSVEQFSKNAGMTSELFYWYSRAFGSRSFNNVKNMPKQELDYLLRVSLSVSPCVRAGLLDEICQRHAVSTLRDELLAFFGVVLDTAHLPFVRPVSTTFVAIDANAMCERLDSKAKCVRDVWNTPCDVNIRRFLRDLLGDTELRRLDSILSTILHKGRIYCAVIDWFMVKELLTRRLELIGLMPPFHIQAATAIGLYVGRVVRTLGLKPDYTGLWHAFLPEFEVPITTLTFDSHLARLELLPVMPYLLPLPRFQLKPKSPHSKQVDIECSELQKCLAWWIVALAQKFARSIISGYRVAAGFTLGREQIVFATSERFRDELIMVILHAGYAARFTLASRHHYNRNIKREVSPTAAYQKCSINLSRSSSYDVWAVSYISDIEDFEFGNRTCCRATATPILRAVTDVKSVRKKCRVWCVTMPHGLVVVRRARREGVYGSVFCASAPTIQGNCFDEFNRLKADQLSAISQQIQVIQDAIKARHATLSLLGSRVPLDHNAGIFVTLNPASKDYGGRSHIPGNLKALFRPIAMDMPNNELIAEVYLKAEGFTSAKELSIKVVALFAFAQDSLTQQRHYDWGLRALKAALHTAGKLAVLSRTTSGTAVDEAIVLIKAVRVSTLSKLTHGDARRFLGLVTDVFPYVSLEDAVAGNLEIALRDVVEASSLSVGKAQIRKMLELKEALDQRMGCVIVGPSGSGKTTVWRSLEAALSKLGQPVKTHVLNPKAMERSRLLGVMDADTREWTDGVLAAAARQVVRDSPGTSWIVSGEDASDPEWIEALNSVLDDNHVLTLPNGERIILGVNVNFIFETHDLKFASPATISRMGIISVSDDDLDIRGVCLKWLADHSALHLEALVNYFFYRAVDLYQAQFRQAEVVKTTLVGTVVSGLSALPRVGEKPPTKAHFACCLARGLGSNLPVAERSKFAKEVFHWAEERPPDYGAPLDCDFDEQVGSLRSLGQRAANLQNRRLQHELPSSTSDYIPTVSSLRALTALDPWVEAAEPFILVGPEGCGKAKLIQEAFASRQKIVITTLYCSAQTSAENVVTKIEETCVLRSGPDGRVYRPRDAERLVLYLKDLNLPKPDQYGTCMLVEFLHQLLTLGGFYDTGLEFLRIDSVQICASIKPATTVGRHSLSTRFIAAVHVLVLDYPDTTELVAICAQLLDERSAKLAVAMVNVYGQIRSTFTNDDQSHYLFTLRDLMAWVHGIKRYATDEDVEEIAVHEALRLFRDRLIDDVAREKCDRLLQKVFPSHKCPFGTPTMYYTTLVANMTGRDQSLTRSSAADFEGRVRAGLETYEREHAPLRLALFPQVLNNIAYVDRVLSRPSGHILLLGRAGIGRRSVTRLVAYLHGVELASPTVPLRCDPGLKQFKADLKPLMALAGGAGKSGVVYLEDRHLALAGTLELLSSLLTSGEVPGLFAADELDLGTIREDAHEANFPGSPFEFFSHRVQSKLHICVAMDPTNPIFDLRCAANPALLAKCDMLWLGSWTRESMRSLAVFFIDDLNDEIFVKQRDHNQDDTLGGPERKSTASRCLVDALVAVHDSLSPPAPPLGFFSLLEIWHGLNKAARGDLGNKLGNLEAGLAKLNDASRTVDDFSKRACMEKDKLLGAQKGADVAMDMITKTLAEATCRRAEVDELKREVAASERATVSRQGEIKQELSSIAPVLESAKAAVGQIKAEHLNEIRSLNMPPEPIADVLRAVLKLLGISDVSWTSMKKFLGNRGVKDEILNFDAHLISGEMRRDVARLLKQKASSFDQASITRVSVAAAPLAAWVKANIRYSVVLERLKPLESQLQEAEDAASSCRQRLCDCEHEIADIDSRVTALKQGFADKTRHAELLKQRLENAEETLTKAQQLIGKLSGEQERWRAQAQDIRDEWTALPRKLVVAAGFVTYLAKYPEDEREALLARWTLEQGLDKGFSLTKLLINESQLLGWNQLGLPSDSLSQENGLIITKCRHATQRIPFIVDPVMSASQWLLAISEGASKGLETVQAADARLASYVELSVRFGKTLIVMDVDGVDAAFYPLVRRDVIVSHGTRACIRFGDKALDFNESFQLTLTTRNPKPNLQPDAAALVVEINFTVTRSGLEGKLLEVTLQQQQPELEGRKKALLQEEGEYKIKLADMEKQLLTALASVEGDLLDNATLIESLTRTKIAARKIQDALAASAKASSLLDKQREAYLPLARSASRLFFIISELVHINMMYQFSQTSYLHLFCRALEDPKHDASEVQLGQLVSRFERSVFSFIGQSLFKIDRATFAMHVVHGMHPEQIHPTEWAFFVGDLGVGVSRSGAATVAPPSWAAADREQSFAEFVTHLPQLARKLELESAARWVQWSRALECEREFPTEVLRETTPFQRVLLVKIFRPDRLMSAIEHLFVEILDLSTLTPPHFSFEECETRADTPILLITTPGADPFQELQEHAAGQANLRFDMLAMGGGTHGTALRLLEIATSDGAWLCLQNLHLVVAWLPTLEKALAAIQHEDKFHISFRLWLTTEQHSEFPCTLLKQSCKITFESPPGTKKNMQRTLAVWGSEFFSAHDAPTRRLLYRLAWFHALVQERCTYVPQGWSKPYDFSVSDLRAGSTVMSAGLDFVAVRSLLEDAVYGGRVDNQRDARVLRIYLQELFCESNCDSLPFGGPNESRCCSFDDCVSAVDCLPDADIPSVFGLPDNIERSTQRASSTRLVDHLRRLASAGVSTVSFDRDLWRAKLSPFLDQWQTLAVPTTYSGGDLETTEAETDRIDPLRDFVAVERAKATNLCQLVNVSMVALKHVLYGTRLLSSVVRAIATALISGNIPSTWAAHWDQGPKDQPTVWLAGLAHKLTALQEDRITSDLSAIHLDLNDVFRPATFLNALRQLTARSSQCPITDLFLICDWSEMRLPETACSVVCRKLLLQGADICRDHLVRATSTSPDLITLRPLTLAFIPNAHVAMCGISLPVYVDTSRQNFVVNFNFASTNADDQSVWVLAGTAIFLRGST